MSEICAPISTTRFDVDFGMPTMAAKLKTKIANMKTPVAMMMLATTTMITRKGADDKD